MRSNKFCASFKEKDRRNNSYTKLKKHIKYKAYKQSRHTSVLILLFNRLIVTKVFDGLLRAIK